MKQVVQNYRTGELWVEEVPAPICRSGGVLVRTAYSLVSAGTERMKVSQARMNMLQMAKARPDKVKQVIQSCKQVGVLETVAKVRERLDTLTPLGYSLAGIVEEVGAGLDDFRVGDRVACGGEGVACHGEFVYVPRNLSVHVPESAGLRDAAFATVGAIALNGVRQAEVTIGDSVLVLGLGLVGQLAVQILKAAGCHVLGIDLDPQKVELAKKCGADLALTRDDPRVEGTLRRATQGQGPDVVYVAASTQSSDPMELAGRVVRDRGKVVIVGMVKVEADWQTYYNKEVSVVMSRSYGPGRYDRNYEAKGVDYPIGYVRWTLRRNMEEFVRLIAAGQVRPSLLSPAVFKIEDAPEAYDQLHKNPGKHAVGILFEYPQDAPPLRRVQLLQDRAADLSPRGPADRRDFEPAEARLALPMSTMGIGLIGAGNFATGTLIPALKRNKAVRLCGICSAGGLSARSAADRHGFEYCASDAAELFNDQRIHAVIIATRHDTHARFAAEALRAGKHVFVEKPLALNVQQLQDLIVVKQKSQGILMPGFNRRFSPMSQGIREAFANRAGPIQVLCRVNAGPLADGSWYNDADEGGWRIVSEGCHFIDLIQFIAGSPIVAVRADCIGGTTPGAQHDNAVINVKLEDGSLGTVLYTAEGDSSFEKERIEVFGQGRAAVIENWHAAAVYEKGKCRKLRHGGTGKGHELELRRFVEAIQTGGPSPLPLNEAIGCTLASLGAAQSLVSGKWEPCTGTESQGLGQ